MRIEQYKRVHAIYGAGRLMWGSDQTQTMGRNRGTCAQNADIIRKYAAPCLPAADLQPGSHPENQVMRECGGRAEPILTKGTR